MDADPRLPERGEAERAALEQLFAIYWKPLYFFLRRKGLPPPAAEDAIQGFFLHLMQQDFLPQQAYEREWALGLMERALTRLRREYEEGKRKGRAETVMRFFALDKAPSYAEAAAECGMTVAQLKAALHRARERFREILREEVAATVEDDGDGEREIVELVRALSP